MKNYLFVLMLALAVAAGTSFADVVWEDDMLSLDAWAEASEAATEEGDAVGGIRVTGTGVQMNSWWDVSNWTSMWIDTGVIVQDEATYTLTMSMESYVAGGQVIPFDLQNAADTWWEWEIYASDSTTVIADGGVNDYTISFDTIGSNNPTAVGKPLGVAVHADWWNNCFIEHASLDEAASVQIAHGPNPATDGAPYDNLNTVGTANGATVDVDLSWKTALDATETVPNPNIVNHLLYVAQDELIDFSDPNYAPDFTGVTAIVIPAGSPVGTDGSYTVTGLDYDAAYIWKVEEELADTSVLPGNAWIFETVNQTPIFTDQPDDTLVVENGSATFELAVTSITTESYQWYTSVDDVVGGDVAISGAISNSVTLSPVALGDAGSYVYCDVTNAGGTVTSRMAMVEVERMMGHWTLDNNMLDSGGAGWNGSMADPNYVDPAFMAQGMGFFGDGEFIEIVGSETAFNNYHLGLTVSAWIKTSNATWGTIAAKENRDGTPWTGWVFITDASGIPSLNYRGVGGVTGTTNVADDAWHFVVATLKDGVARVYVDGILEGETDLSGGIDLDDPVASGTPLDDRPVTIGAEDINGQTSLTGLLDDVKIYNYGRAYTVVVDEYNTNVDPDANPCIADLYVVAADISGPDGDPDCRIDIYDFVEMAGGWMDNGCYPNPDGCL